MRNFDYDNNEEFQPDIDKFFYEEDEEFFTESEAIEAMELEIAETGINLRLIKIAIKTCEKTFFWRFYTHAYKMKLIKKTYKVLENLIDLKEIE
jgi:hypothetical protein